MRLIDADELKKELRKFLANNNHMNNPSTTYLDVLDVVEEQPTAYDIDKVVEELGKEKDIHTEHFHISIYKDMPEIKQRYKQAIGVIDKAIEIVKQGLKEQNK